MSVQKRSMCAPARPLVRRDARKGGQRRARIGASARVEAAVTREFERFDADLVPCGDISVALSTTGGTIIKHANDLVVVSEPRRRCAELAHVVTESRNGIDVEHSLDKLTPSLPAGGVWS